MTQWGLDNLFNPGKRHMDDEKRRLQSTREEVGDNSGGRRIDLEGGKVSIAVRRPTDVAVEEPSDADDTALAAALEAEDVPAVALANDEAEIAPELVDDSPVEDVVASEPEPAAVVAPEPAAAGTPEVVESVAAVEAVATDAPVVDDPAVTARAEDDDAVEADALEDEPVEAAAIEDEPVEAADDVPIEAPPPVPVAAAPRRKQLSASAWSRRG